MDVYIASTIMTTIITTMVVIIIMVVNTDSHYCKCRKIRGIIPIIIRRVIWHIGGRIYILHNWHLLNHYNSS